MDNQELARRVMRRLKGEPDVYTLPEMPRDIHIDYLDSLRLPERLEQIARNLNVTPEFRASENGAHYIHEQETKRADIQHMLDLLHAGFTAGELSPDEYTRLTTPQNYTGAYRQALNERLARYIPTWIMNGSKGAVYSLQVADGSYIDLRYENDNWIKDDDPFGKKDRIEAKHG